LWSKRFGDAEWQLAQSVAVDASDNVVVAGHSTGAIDLGGGALLSEGYHDLFLAQLTADGNHLWSKSFGDIGEQVEPRIAVDLAGNIAISGSFESNIDLGGETLASPGVWSKFVARFAADGSHLWSRQFAGGTGSGADAIAVDPTGNVVVATGCEGPTDYGGARSRASARSTSSSPSSRRMARTSGASASAMPCRLRSRSTRRATSSSRGGSPAPPISADYR